MPSRAWDLFQEKMNQAALTFLREIESEWEIPVARPRIEEEPVEHSVVS